MAENQGKTWRQLVEAYLTLVRHVSMRPVMTALRPNPVKS